MRRALLVLLAAIATGAAQRPTFTVNTDLVRVDVLVERNGTPLSGLGADDFVVEDNGVRQRVRLLSDAGAVSVTTVLDVSGSMTPAKLANAGAGVRALMAALDDRDRHLLFGFAGETWRVVLPAASDAVPADSIARALRGPRVAHTSLFDALFASIVLSDAGPGPKLLAVLTDGRNNTSWLSAQAVIDAANRHDTVIYAISVSQDLPRRGSALPPIAEDDGYRLLEVLAHRTGGRVVSAGWNRDLGPVFASLIREYRQRYILSFVSEGVPRGDGWHRIEVRLRNRSGKVHARSGYWSR